MSAKGYNPNRRRTGEFTNSGGNQARAAAKAIASSKRGSTRTTSKAVTAKARATARKKRSAKTPAVAGDMLSALAMYQRRYMAIPEATRAANLKREAKIRTARGKARAAGVKIRTPRREV